MPYTIPKVPIDNKLEKPSQKLPRVVLANLALDLDVAVYHQALLVLKTNFKLLNNIFTIIIMCMIII